MRHPIDEVARLYSEAETTPSTIRHYAALSLLNRKYFERLLARGYSIVPTDDPDRFRHADELRRHLSRTLALPIFTGDLVHPLMSPEDNLVFRFVHDILAHGASNQAGFSFLGEYRAFLTQARLYPRELHGILFAEIVGQAAYYFASQKQFPEQRAVSLHPLLLS